ncbi:MRO2B protein, partial [Heliornis fulica]|nr:MRO2B protein [Heliornis fulica]
SAALRCIPFVLITLPALHAMLSRVWSSRNLRAVCSVLEQWSKAIKTYLCRQKQCPFPHNGEGQLSEAIYPLFSYVVVNWLSCSKEEDKQAVLRAVAAMMDVLQEGQHRDHAWEKVLWHLHQYQHIEDNPQVTQSRSCAGLGLLEGRAEAVPPPSKAMPIFSQRTLFPQLPDVTQVAGPAHKAEPFCCVRWQTTTCTTEPVVSLHTQKRILNELSCVASLRLLTELASSDADAVREKLPQVLEALKLVRNHRSTEMQRAVLEFIRELLSSGNPNCDSWDVVGHIFKEFSRTSNRLVRAQTERIALFQVSGSLLAWESVEEGALRALCMDIVGSLDVSQRGMTKLLWPRLLQCVVPAQYSSMLIPLSKCLRALVERREKAGGEEEEPNAKDSQEQAQLPSSQALLARLLVLAAALHKSRDQAVAALQLLQALHVKIHSALGAVWVIKIPILLQYLEGKVWVRTESGAGREGGRE